MIGKPKTLKPLLGIGLIGLCAAPILAVGLYASAGVGDYARGDAEETLLDMSAQIASKLDLGMHERWRDMALAATMLATGGGAGELRGDLEAVQRQSPVYAWIGVADTAGRVSASTGGLLEGADVSGRPWFRAGMQGPFAGDVHEAVLLAKALPAPQDGEPLRFVDIAMPLVRADGVPLGVLGAHLSWSWVDEVSRSVLAWDGGRQDGAEALVVSREGTVLMGPSELRGRTLDLPSVRAGQQGVAQGSLDVWPDGRRYYSAAAPTRGEGDYRGVGWIVLVRDHAETALAAATSIQRRILAVTAVAALLACAVGWTLAGRIARPVATLAERARRLADGDLTVTVPPTRAFAEAVTLASSLTRLADALAGRRHP
ncbi:HAMP domain-containing protein [Azospirillum sp. ST 5-10]|uniref:HAMP domain-containing protein n=1 Tax=unclassified Azospirillum TaxID=2630922 RepID=UPI003F49CAFB